MKRLTALPAVFCVLAMAVSVPAAELLTNGDFNQPGTGAAATGWTPWSWGGGWANTEIAGWGSPGGTYHIAVGAAGNGGGGVYQIVPGAPGVEFTLTVLSGADAWWLPTGRMEMFFLNSTNGVITNATRLTVDPAVYGVTNTDIAHPWTSYTLVATSPVDTAFVKVEFSCNESSFDTNNTGVATGSVGFDDASLTAPIDPPAISNVKPVGLLNATNTFSFTASSVVAIATSNISLVLNGEDVSGSLAFSGSSTSWDVSYTGLDSNQTYTAEITVTDDANLTAFTTVTLDTYSPVFTWEAEDYDYGSGQYINDPTPSDVPAGNSYFDLIGTEGVDFHDPHGNGSHSYRSADFMATEATSDATRQQFLDAGASDYNVGWFDGAGFGENNVGITSYDAGEWVNYTRDLPAGTYHIYGRVANGNGGTATIPLSKVVSGWGTMSQTTTGLGAFSFPAIGWGNYAYVPLTDDLGNKVAVALSGTNTLRVTAGSGGNLNFFMLMPVDNAQPTITDLYPNGRTLLQGTNALTFTVSSASHSIAQSNVVMTLNGVDVSGTLSFSGSTSSWDVSAPLELRITNYAAVISVTDDVGNSHSVTRYFDTFDPASFVVEGEDFDFQNGQFIDNPVITSNAAANSYFDTESVTLVDSYEGTNATPPTADFRYRQLDPIATSVCTDTPMQKTLDAQATNALAFNYNAAWWSPEGWLNYTRTYPAGDFNIYGRLAGGDGSAYSISLDEVNGTTNHLGDFVGVGRGYPFFDWIPLVDTNGQLAVVTLGGVTTLRATTAVGDVNPNNFLFVPAMAAPEELQWSYADGVLTLSWDDAAFRLQSQTNAPGAGISTGWSDYPGGATSPVNVTVDPAEGSLFFRLTD